MTHPVPAPHAATRALEAAQHREFMREVLRRYRPRFSGAPLSIARPAAFRTNGPETFRTDEIPR